MFTNDEVTIVHILALYLTFFVLLYPITCLLLFLNIVKKPQWIHSVGGIFSVALDIMLSHFKVAFMAWVVSAGIGGILAFISLIVVGMASKWMGSDTDIIDSIVYWVQAVIITLGQIIGYVVTIMMHNAEVRQ